MDNQTVALPPLPSFSLKPVPRLVPWLSDFHLSLVLPVLAYWLMSLIFHLISTYNLFSKYRLHTPQEFKTRNRVTVGEVLRSIILQQTIQTALGLWLGYVLEAGDYYGKEEYDIAVWARRMHQTGDAIPCLLAAVGIDARMLGYNLQRYAQSFSPPASAEKPMAIVNLVMTPHIGQQEWTGGYTAWEIYAAKTLYWVLEPAARFGIAILFSDSWQYFWHRAMHSNKWMFRTFLPPPILTSHHPPSAEKKILPTYNNNVYQATCTRTTTKSTFPTPSAPSTTPSPKPSSSTPSARRSRSSSPVSQSAKQCVSARFPF